MKLISKLIIFLPGLALVIGHDIGVEPEDALGPMWSDYKGRGFNQTLGEDLVVYIAGLPGTTDTAVVWGHDIYGPGSGTTYKLVDQLAEDTGYLVLLPDFFRGDVFPPPRKWTWADPIQSDWEETLMPFMQALGITTIGTVGTCWGGYFIVHAGAYPEVRAGFGAHPAQHIMIGLIQDELTEEEQYEAINAVGGAQYYFPTITESATVKPGGLADQTLDTVFIHEMDPPCTHGYFNRGNLSDPEVAACVDFTYSEMISFFDEYLV